MRVVVTGGAGFIGSALVRQLLAESDIAVINIDALTYAGDPRTLGPAMEDPRHTFLPIDIRDRAAVDQVFREHQPDAVIHLAAESHVDRSIAGPEAFTQTNILGTQRLLEAARAYFENLPQSGANNFRFLHISTDEVYGELGPDDPPFDEATPFAPRSPYAASKAASDHLAAAWYHTYGLPVIITHCSNNYGPRQFPEKLIPRMIQCALAGEPLPIYGQGENVRDWLHVEDHVRALQIVLAAGRPGRSYNIGGRAERTNLEVVRAIASSLDRLVPRESGSYEALIAFVADRPGHDQRYAIDDRRIREELNWQPAYAFERGLHDTVTWYLQHPDWLDAAVRRLQDGTMGYACERVGERA